MVDFDDFFFHFACYQLFPSFTPRTFFLFFFLSGAHLFLVLLQTTAKKTEEKLYNLSSKAVKKSSVTKSSR
jgi:hypothetical protein